MDIVMPPAFPETEFRAFGLATRPFFPELLSHEALYDPLEKMRQFDWSWQAVRYRYRSCAECQDEFRALLKNASEEWRAGLGDEELTYKLERCIYVFFVSGLSVFDSLAFCLYFLGNALRPDAFPGVAHPRSITRKTTSQAFSVAFPQARLAALLTGLQNDARFNAIDMVRNLVGHRISGRRSVRSSATLHRDGTHTVDWHEETWHLPGAGGTLTFDEEMLQRPLNDITDLLIPLATAAHEFAESNQPGKAA